MTTIVERDVHHHGEDSSVASVIIGLLAIVLIVGLALYAFQVYPFAAREGSTIDVNVNGDLPNPANP
jgi:hypothetical protein